MLAKQREKKRYIETVANTSKSTSLDGSSQKTEKRVNERETQTTHPKRRKPSVGLRNKERHVETVASGWNWAIARC